MAIMGFLRNDDMSRNNVHTMIRAKPASKGCSRAVLIHERRNDEATMANAMGALKRSSSVVSAASVYDMSARRTRRELTCGTGAATANAQSKVESRI